MLRFYSRRKFLKTACWTPALFAGEPSTPLGWANTGHSASKSDSESGNVLVVIQLAGGNDGLNTIVPYADDEYSRNRRTLRLGSGEVCRIDDYLGFHPEMEALWELFEEGFVRIVQGVGYPNSPRSHPPAMRDWHTGRPNAPNPQRGWLGAASDEQLGDPGCQNGAVFVGNIELPFILNAREAIIPSLNSSRQLIYGTESPDRFSREIVTESAPISRSNGNSLLDFVRQQADRSREFSRRIAAVKESDSNSSSYPQIRLAQNLRTIAQLIRAEVGFTMYLTELGGPPPGGFDNHANQQGNHAVLLRQLSDSIAAFVDDLKKDGLLDHVILMTYSEFGRTLAENGRRGTGHGAAAPLLLVGSRTKGGIVGTHPNLKNLEDGALMYSTDFRSVYATILEDWMEIDSKSVLGREFSRLDLFRTSSG